MLNGRFFLICKTDMNNDFKICFRVDKFLSLSLVDEIFKGSDSSID